jgi:hypothetical protein
MIFLSTANSSIATILFTNPSAHKINCVALKILIYMEHGLMKPKKLVQKQLHPHNIWMVFFEPKSWMPTKGLSMVHWGKRKIKELVVVNPNQNYLAVRVQMQTFYRERQTAWLDDVCVCTSMLRAISARFSESQASWNRREHIYWESASFESRER